MWLDYTKNMNKKQLHHNVVVCSVFGHMVAGKIFGIAADLMERKVMKKENHKNMPKTTSRNRLALIG